MNDTLCTPCIYKAIAVVQGELAKIGISKDRQNQQQNYAFRGIDDVYAALAPLLAKNNLCILPRVGDREVVERTTRSGGVLFYVTISAEFDLVCATDGSRHTVRTFGEAMDSADKATNKAMSAAYKYMCLQTFCIPTEGDNDADATTHDVRPKEGIESKAAAKPQPKPGAPPPSPSPANGLQYGDFANELLGFGRHRERTWGQMTEDEEHRDYLEWVRDKMDAKGKNSELAKQRATVALASFDELINLGSDTEPEPDQRDKPAEFHNTQGDDIPF